MKKFLLYVLPVLVGAGLGYVVFNTPPESAQAALETSSSETQTAEPAAKLTWLHDPEAAKAESQRTSKPILKLFTADWCTTCDFLKDRALIDPEVQQGIATTFVPLIQDLSERDQSAANPAAQKYGVAALPQLIVTDADGQEISRHIGAMGRVTTLKWIAQHQ